MTCHDIPGAYTTGEVNVGYHPHRMTINDVYLRIAPREDAPRVNVIYAPWRPDDPNQPLAPHQADFGWQSTRNPTYDPNPPKRPTVNGYAWGYVRTGHCGWINAQHLEPFTPPDNTYPLFDGPAHDDFEVGRQHPRHGYVSNCGPRVDGWRIIRAKEVYLRYAPESTAFAILTRGDVVHLKCMGEHHYFCVTVHRSRYVPKGTTGWISEETTRHSRLPWRR